jgi:hypothetical protein
MDDLSAPSAWQATRFEVRTQIKPIDYVQMMQIIRWSACERLIGWLATVGICGLGAVIAFFTAERFTAGLPDYAYWNWAFAVGGALVAFLLYKVFVLGPYIESMFKGQPIGAGESTIVADATAVTATVMDIATRVPWSRIENVVVAKDQLFLMYGRLTGLIIPRRAFADDSEAKRFADFAHHMTRTPG